MAKELQCANTRLTVYNIMFMFGTDICGLCNLCLPVDDYHHVLTCPFLTTVEKNTHKTIFLQQTNIIKFNILLS